MRICGFSIARNALRFGYPLEASLRSMLPLVDEIVLNVGDGDDGTWDLVQSMGEPKIKSFRSSWNMNLRHRGWLLAQQTNLALGRCQGDWGLYLQADEVLHEQDHPIIRQSMEKHLKRATEALSFRYHHCYGSFQTMQDNPRRWYPCAIRAVKLGIGAVSWGDAMDFGLCEGGRGRYLKQVESGAYIYHYGWVRPPHVMLAKQKNFHSLYYDDAWLEMEYRDKKPDDLYNERGHLRFFQGTHPSVMQDIVAQQSWHYDHRVDKQWPDWLRHSYVWAPYQLWRQFHRGELYLQRMGRAVTERFRHPSLAPGPEE